MQDRMSELRPFVQGSGGTIVEVGSRDGHDAHAMGQIFRSSRTVVVEASPRCYDQIIAEYPQLEVYNCAITNRTGEVDFWEVRPEFGPTIVGQSSTLYKASYSEIADRITVPALTMDDFVDECDIKEIEALKIDVEGATLEVLEGFSKIRMTRLLHIESEHVPFWDGQKMYESTASHLERAGFERVYFRPVWTEQSDSIWRRIE